MNMEIKQEIKTLSGWNVFAEENKEGSWDKYCQPGDLVDEGVYDYFLDILPPKSIKRGYLQAASCWLLPTAWKVPGYGRNTVCKS